MWAQGLTIGILIATGIITHSQREEAAKHNSVDHSWRELLEAEAREAESRKIKRFDPATVGGEVVLIKPTTVLAFICRFMVSVKHNNV